MVSHDDIDTMTAFRRAKDASWLSGHYARLHQQTNDLSPCIILALKPGNIESDHFGRSERETVLLYHHWDRSTSRQHICIIIILSVGSCVNHQ